MVHIAPSTMREHQCRDRLGCLAVYPADVPIPDAKRKPSQWGLGQFTNRLDDRSYEAILQGFVDAHPVIPVGILSNTLE